MDRLEMRVVNKEDVKRGYAVGNDFAEQISRDLNKKIGRVNESHDFAMALIIGFLDVFWEMREIIGNLEEDFEEDDDDELEFEFPEPADVA